MIDEIWKPIPGSDGYEVSNMGNVRSWLRPGYGENRIMNTPHLLKPTGRGTRRNYLAVGIGGNKQAYIAHLVLQAFVGPRPDGMEACHNDGDTSNNRLDNLRWDTHLGNESDKVRHNTRLAGERVKTHKITESDVVTIREMSMRGVSRKKIAAKFCVRESTINRITSGKRWASAPGPIHTPDNPYKRKEPIYNYLAEHPELSVGERNGRAILTEDDVREIRRLISAGKTQKEIAAHFGVKKATVSAIATGRNWKHVV